jgi:RNA polymerase sigma-70 factor (ECF subfamily)
MSADPSFDHLMSRLRAGDEDAARRVFDEFAGRLIALARRRLGGPLRQKVDPEDALQSAYRSFFRRQARGELTPESWDGLWAILAVITLRKCGRWIERFHTARRDLAAEVAPAAAADGSADFRETAASGPGPAEEAALHETLDNLLAGLEPRERTIVTLALQGATVAEISAEVGRTRRTVQRVLARVKEHLERECGPAEEDR